MQGPDRFPSQCLCLDLETSHEAEARVHKIGAWRADTGQSAAFQGRYTETRVRAALDGLTLGAEFLLGHNIALHDLPILRKLHPGFALHGLPVIDTLWLSPLAFPQNPYHRLVKDYKLVRDSRNDPLKDAQLAFRLFGDQVEAFEQLHRDSPAELACQHFLLAGIPGADYDRWFRAIRGAVRPNPEAVRDHIRAVAGAKVCSTSLARLLDDDLARPESHLPLAYVLAWLRVAGGNSVLPPWVSHRHPRVPGWIRALRDTACADPDCTYCRCHHDPKQELERWFGFREFRPEPANPAGGSLQEDIVQAGMARENLLAVLPTGGGKSLCYQLPGLSRYWRNGSLTVIISPLQSLMKDQVDGLIRQGIFSGTALNGLLSMPERRDVLEKVRLGDIGILLVSPEQFRNSGFTEAIKQREIGAWVFDEAHCLSKWGHDFRTDYLYVSRSIRERHGDALPPIACFTATAKLEVIADLDEHFRDSLGIRLRHYIGGHERTNLHFEVMPVRKHEKLPLIHSLLEAELKASAGSAVVFTARRKSAEEIAAFLEDMRWPCAAFHAGLDSGRKQEVQKAFIAGETRIIAATNAFGMGVDKPDVRVVIHAEIPGSLENYLQEAGRAGRDREDSRCILLYDEEDVETQFGLAARSRLSRKDIAEILRVLRRRAARTQSDEIVITAGEILAEEEIDTAIDPGNPDADTKVKTAVAWLERSRFLRRDQNRTRIYPASLKLPSLEAVEKHLAQQNFSQDMRRKYLDLVSAILNAEDDEGISTDRLMLETGLSSEECLHILHGLEQIGVLSNDIVLAVLLRKGIADDSGDRFRRVCRMERDLLDLLPELAPDANEEDWQDLHLPELCQELQRRTEQAFIPDELLALLNTLSRPFGESTARRALFSLRKVRREYLRLRLRRGWRNIREITELRRGVAQALLSFLLGRLPETTRGADLRVECTLGELAGALRGDLGLAAQVKDIPKAIETGLLYLHEMQVLIIDRGKSVFRPAMTIRLYPEEPRRRFVQSDYQPLFEHYRERNFQVHVMQEYARLGLKKLVEALAFVAAYFSWPKPRFVREYFAGRREVLDLATTEESWRRIVGDLKHPLQEKLVSEKPESNRLILAGPGSGKTRVIVHRVAYLLRVLRVPAESVIVLAFNRSAAAEVRRRLHALVGDEAYGVTVLTYHALALRLTGTSLAVLAETGTEPDLDAVLDRAVALLEGRAEIGSDPDELRDRLLRGYAYILVDEYQDIDARQYALIGALTGRGREDPDAKLTILAVGDDDQNIYAFRHTSVEFIRRFEKDYEARTEYLVENYRSTQHIISAANAIIQRNRDRLKIDHPIRIDFNRRDHPPGSRWTRLDPVVQGRVQVLTVPDDGNRQAQIAMAELERLKALDPASDWSDFAVLARTHAMLQPIRAWCEWRGVPCLMVDTGDGQPKLHQTREGQALIRLLRGRRHRLIRRGALGRWMARHREPGNPWSDILEQYIAEIETTWQGLPIPVGQTLDAIYEFSAEARRSHAGCLNLSTVHGAKGREFRHVLILDGGDWRRSSGEERRLYYVGMTRARETLTLCQALQRPNPYTRELEDGEFLLRTPPQEFPPARPELDRRYKLLALGDVDLGYAGRRGPADPVHRAIGRLRVGDSLQYSETEGYRELRDGRGVVVGRLSRGCELPAGTVVRVTVSAIVVRGKGQSKDSDFEARCRVEEWEVVLANMELLRAGRRIP